MINYQSLPLITTNNNSWDLDSEEMKHGYELLNPAFLLSDATIFLQGKSNMKVDSSALLNIMGNREVAGNLLYCQFFSIMNAYYGYFTEREKVDSYELRFTLKGSGTLVYRDKKYVMKEGEGFFISNQEYHYYCAGKEGWKCTVLHINGSLCKQFFEEFISSGSVKFSQEKFPAFETLQFQVLQTTQKIVPYMKYRISCVLDLLLTELLASQTALSTTITSSNETIATVIEYLQQNYSNKIVFHSLATQFGISRSALFADFKQYTGYTPADYLMEIRLTQAKLLLRGTDQSVENIATLSGFNDAGHFSQIFKRNIGTTPLKYRKI